jgi:signal transduction histidine kinase
MVEALLQQQIHEQLFGKLDFAYICIDSEMMVVDVSDNLASYGYTEVVIGVSVESTIDFMIGLDVHTELDLPMIESPAGIPISVSLLPSEPYLTVLISNVSTQAEQRQLLQQKANENELLLERQNKMTLQLERASRMLEDKNKQLEEASRLQTSFLSGVSHEFRTPLTSIIGYTSLVEQGIHAGDSSLLTDVDEKAAHLRAVQRSSKHLLSLVENLLDHGKLDSDELVVRPKKTDVLELLDDVKLLMKPLSDAKHIELVTEHKIDIPAFVAIDDTRLRQCLINIMGNAIKFTDIGRVVLQAKLCDEFLHILVQDTGPGITVEDLGKIRLPFWQAADTGKAGTGLGLTITERIIELMGGDLEISSTLDVGTTVSFRIPAPSIADELENNTNAIEPVRSYTKVLLAEDDYDIAELMVMLLAERGVDVTHVENGALAVTALATSDFDFVLMDIQMPVMTGYEALVELRRTNNLTPVVIMSASAVDADREKAQELGCFEYLIKPVDIDDVIEIMNQSC